MNKILYILIILPSLLQAQIKTPMRVNSPWLFDSLTMNYVNGNADTLFASYDLTTRRVKMIGKTALAATLGIVINPGGETLQSVMTRGATSSTYMNLTNGATISALLVGSGGFAQSNGTYSNTLTNPGLTASRSNQWPNRDGRLATLNDITDSLNARGGVTPTFQQVTTAGNTTTNSVGIGSSGYGKLQVYDANTGYVPAAYFAGDSSGVDIGTKATSSNSDKWIFRAFRGLTNPSAGISGGNLIFGVHNNGNVSIGASLPSYKLDVIGTGRFTDSLTMSNYVYFGQPSKIEMNTLTNASNLNGAQFLIKSGTVLRGVDSSYLFSRFYVDTTTRNTGLTNYGRSIYLSDSVARRRASDSVRGLAVLTTTDQGINGYKTFNGSVNFNSATSLVNGLYGELGFYNPVAANFALLKGNPSTISVGSVFLPSKVNDTIAVKGDLPVYGSSTQTAGAGLTSYTIAHGQSGVTSSSKVFVTARTVDAGGWRYIDVDATNITIYYSVSPTTSTSLKWDWEIKK